MTSEALLVAGVDGGGTNIEVGPVDADHMVHRWAMSGVVSTINLLDLDLVVIGGGLAEKLGQDLADRLATAAAPWMLQPSPDLRFVVAALGDDSGVVGAASLGRAALVAG